MALPLTPEEIQAALSGPAAAPPNEETAPNLENPSRDNATAYWVTGFALVLASIVVLVRVYARVFRTKRVRPEDSKNSISSFHTSPSDLAHFFASLRSPVICKHIEFCNQARLSFHFVGHRTPT